MAPDVIAAGVLEFASCVGEGVDIDGEVVCATDIVLEDELVPEVDVSADVVEDIVLELRVSADIVVEVRAVDEEDDELTVLLVASIGAN